MLLLNQPHIISSPYDLGSGIPPLPRVRHWAKSLVAELHCFSGRRSLYTEKRDRMQLWVILKIGDFQLGPSERDIDLRHCLNC